MVWTWAWHTWSNQTALLRAECTLVFNFAFFALQLIGLTMAENQSRAVEQLAEAWQGSCPPAHKRGNLRLLFHPARPPGMVPRAPEQERIRAHIPAG